MRDVRQNDGDELGPTFVDGSPGVRANEEGAMPKMGRHLGREVRAGTLEMEEHRRNVIRQLRGREQV